MSHEPIEEADLLIFTLSGSVLFRPLTPRALEAFSGLRLDANGFHMAPQGEAVRLRSRLEAAGLMAQDM